MKTHFEYRSARNVIGNALAGIFVLCIFALAISGQAPPNPIPPQENIAAGALVIPLDNVNQGNAGGTTFNLRAYGLANALLQNNVPLKWAIKPNKAKDAEDFAANVTRIAGTAGVAGPANVSFSGSAFIVPTEYDTPTVRTLIANFNSGGTPVVVYETNANVLVDIRYNVTHKPLIAIGPDGGNFGTGVHQDLFDSAGIPNYTSVDDDIINADSCYTMATQAHSTDPTFVNLYRQFAVSGGNLLLQCASVGTFENAANGHFQTTNPGYALFGTNAPANAVDTTLFYPEGAMPFNQFIGILANQDGAVTEYAYAVGGGAANGNRVSVRNTSPHSEKFVATVSQLTAGAGGTVFELGAHNYGRPNTAIPVADSLAMLNGQRMILNAIFVPVSRPQACGLEQATVNGYKSVRRLNVRNGGPPLIAGDTLRWTIDYINNSPVDINNFQIRDIVSSINGSLTGNLTLVPGSNTVTILAGGATGTRNPNYDGIGNDATSDMLNAGAFLPVNGRIQMTVDMTINLLGSNNQPLPDGTILWNQPEASGSTLVSTSKSDAIDTTNTNIFGVDPPPPGSFSQFQNPGILDPTIARIKRPGGPTAATASVEGEVRNTTGAGIAGAIVTAVNASTGAYTAVRSNSQGRYRINDLRVGEFYLVTVDHKQYIFPGGSVTFTLNDNVTGLTFVGSLPGSKVEPAKSGGRQTRW